MSPQATPHAYMKSMSQAALVAAQLTFIVPA